MSYNSPHSNGPGGQWYDDYGIPAYHEQGSRKPQKHPRPQQQDYLQYQQYQQHASDPRMKFPRPQAYPRAQQMDTRDLYDDNDPVDYEHDQWPLSAQPLPGHEPPPRRPNGARPPPRPQRPDFVPPPVEPPRQSARATPPKRPSQHQTMQQSSRSHEQLPSQQFHHGTGQWNGDGYSIPTSASSPPSHSHPVHQQASYARLPPRPPLGPPPSSRRGPSSYYAQQMSPVHPIVEEAESSRHSNSRSSLTSSNAIPIGIPRFYLDGRESGVSITPDSEIPPYSSTNSTPRQEPALKPFKQRMQEAAADDYFVHDRGESPSERNIPVRQASLGKRSKPTLTTVKNGDRMRKRSSSSAETGSNVPTPQAMPTGDRTSQQNQKQVSSNNGGAVTGAEFDESPTAPPMPPFHRGGESTPEASYFDSSSGSGISPQHQRNAPLDSPAMSVRIVNNSDDSLATPVKQQEQQQQQQLPGRSPLAHADDYDDDYDDAFSKEIMRDPEKIGELMRGDSDTLQAPTDGFSGLRAGKRRPPRLNVDAIKDEEARGSLTSLSDLIKRATRLASNLDRGRTASRLGMDHFLNGADAGENQRRSAGSLSDILNSFPPPGAPTPNGEHRGSGRWSSRHQSRPLPSDSDGGSHKRKQRRCCGIPLWLFLLLVLVLLLLVAAATVIPIVLIVLPNQDSTSTPDGQASTGTQASTLSQCSESLKCENGGQAFPSSESEDTCRCVCVNSFTGPTCSKKSTAGCSSLAIPGMSENATVGDAIPRLINVADDKYSIPLDARILLGIFNEEDLGCASENALVSFNGKAQRRVRRDVSSALTLAKRSSQASQSTVHPAEATSNGIVFDSTPSPTEHSVSQDSTPSSTTSSSTSSPSASTSSKPDLDFARAAVLYILQDSASLQDAEAAQNSLQEALDAGKGSGVVEIGDGEWQVDLGKRVLKNKDGEAVGGE
ncbi:hypothetical protein Q7P37_006426 [Cladosporium fusiforme]